MIPMRIRMFILTALCNLGSYSLQALELIYYFIADGILDLFTGITEGMYSFFFSHREAFRYKTKDKWSRTTYVKDGYGRRYRKVSPATKKFYAINYRPIFRRYFR